MQSSFKQYKDLQKMKRSSLVSERNWQRDFNTGAKQARLVVCRICCANERITYEAYEAGWWLTEGIKAQPGCIPIRIAGARTATVQEEASIVLILG